MYSLTSIDNFAMVDLDNKMSNRDFQGRRIIFVVIFVYTIHFAEEQLCFA